MERDVAPHSFLGILKEARQVFAIEGRNAVLCNVFSDLAQVIGKLIGSGHGQTCGYVLQEHVIPDLLKRIDVVDVEIHIGKRQVHLLGRQILIDSEVYPKAKRSACEGFGIGNIGTEFCRTIIERGGRGIRRNAARYIVVFVVRSGCRIDRSRKPAGTFEIGRASCRERV